MLQRTQTQALVGPSTSADAVRACPTARRGCSVPRCAVHAASQLMARAAQQKCGTESCSDRRNRWLAEARCRCKLPAPWMAILRKPYRTRRKPRPHFLVWPLSQWWCAGRARGWDRMPSTAAARASPCQNALNSVSRRRKTELSLRRRQRSSSRARTYQ
eukprot:5034384-Pleurochrysis_carterae.AAC.1